MKKFFMLLGIIFSIIVLAFIMLVADTVYNDLKLEKKLNNEFEIISELIHEDIWNSEIDHKLNSNITKKEYLIVEKAVKSYYISLVKEYRNLNRLYNSYPLLNLMNNIIIDSPDYSNTFAFVNETKEEIKKVETSILNLLSKKVIKENMPENLDEYYTDYYNEFIFDDKELADLRNEIKKEIKETIELLDNYESLFNILKDNKDSWYIESDEIYFKDEVAKTKYDEVAKEIEKIIIRDNSSNL